MTHSKRNFDFQVSSLSICPLESQACQNLSEKNIREIRGGLARLPEPISVPTPPTRPPSDYVICPPVPPIM